VRIAELDEMSYRRQLWNHRPLTDFWRVGKGYMRKLEQHGLYTMGDVARRSVQNEESLYRMFGKNAELLIDHAWGWEPCTIEAIKAYHPESKSLGSGQVLHEPYSPEKAKLVLREMADLLVLDLVEKGLVTDQIVITVGYDIENLTDPVRRRQYQGAITTDAYGREVPAHSHGTHNLGRYTSSTKLILQAVTELADRLVDMNLLVRRLNIVANHVVPEDKAPQQDQSMQQLDLFTDYEALERQRKAEEEKRAKERKLQEAMLDVRKKFGKNAVIKGINMEEGATGRERYQQVGGHKA
jgi:DNA polymerase V